MKISNRIPGGNIRVISIEGKRALLDVELRDTKGDWFYWSFQAVFPEPGIYEFRFECPNRICTRGPAFSLDGGVNWQWLAPEGYPGTQSFSYEHKGGNDTVLFCMGISYLQRDFDRFRKELSSPYLSCTELCRSRRGRSVELVTVREGEPKRKILLTSRHHAGEMMATHALEGILRAVCADTEFGREFRRTAMIYAVPFVDKDGVEDGDQGKNRMPHDHARDYGPAPIYPETGAIMKLLDAEKPEFVLDMHCPWLRGGETNEFAYMVGCASERMNPEMDRFGGLLEEESRPEAPFRKADNLPYGVSWNAGANYTQGMTLKQYSSAALPYVVCAQVLEIPFANFRDVTVDRRSMLIFGESIARAILRYLKG